MTVTLEARQHALAVLDEALAQIDQAEKDDHEPAPVVQAKRPKRTRRAAPVRPCPAPTTPPIDTRHDYLAKGWEVLVLPAGQKGPPPVGTTGYAGQAMSAERLDRWAERHPDANLGLRLPEGVIGVDLDVYRDGDRSLAELEAALGPLPYSPNLSSRKDGSGIRFYRVPAGTRLRGEMGVGVDVIQRHHRYAVTGIHPTGRMYLWSCGSVPNVTELPELPATWLRHASV